MDTYTAILSFVDSFQLETQTLPTGADIAERFPDTDVTPALNFLVNIQDLIGYMGSYAITDEGLAGMRKAMGLDVLVSGSMVIGIDPADDPAAFNEFRGIVASQRNGADFVAQHIGNDPRVMFRSTKYTYPVYFSQWFEAPTALGFKQPLDVNSESWPYSE